MSPEDWGSSRNGRPASILADYAKQIVSTETVNGLAERLSFIRNCRSLDMTLDEIRVLLRFKDSPAENCGAVNELLDQHVGHVSSRIRELRQLERQLRDLRDLCQEARDAEHCGILNELTQTSRKTPEKNAVHVRSVHKGGKQSDGA